MIWGGRVDRAAVRRQGEFLDEAFGASTAAGVLVGLDEAVVSDGHPVWFDDGAPLEELNEFLRGPYRLSTASAYGGDIAELARFLDGRGKTLVGASSTDAEDFKRGRLSEVGSDRWCRQGTAISVYYRWAVATGRMAEPPIRRWPDDNGRDLYTPHRRRQRLVRFLRAEEYRWFRDECLGGVGDGVREPLFSDLAVESGARRSEINRLSWIGLPDRHPGQNPTEVWVVGKGSKCRQVYLSWTTLQKVLAYRLGPRADAVESAQTYLQARLRAGEVNVCELGSPDRQGRPQLRLEGRMRPLVDISDAALARAVVRRDDHSLDPLGLFISARGARLLDPSHWNRMFAAANKAAHHLNDSFPRVTPHVLRHTFAVHLLSALLQRLAAANQTATIQVLEEPRLFIARLLGHADPASTLVYLEAAMRASGEPLAALAEMCELFDADPSQDHT
ncbi:MAG: tyrosine-type recombinase/integrase [Acidimicrobiales bacterium]